MLQMVVQHVQGSRGHRVPPQDVSHHLLSNNHSLCGDMGFFYMYIHWLCKIQQYFLAKLHLE